MSMRRRYFWTSLCLVLLAGLVLTTAGSDGTAAQEKGKEGKAKAAGKMNMAVAVVTPTKGNKVKGMVMFTQMGNKVKVSGHFSGLTPNQKHGFHVHEYGYCGSDDGLCTGGHFDPKGTKHHALPGSTEAHHAGDMGNIQADGEGNAKYEAEFTTMTLTGNAGIIGRGIVVHAKPDDGGQPTGNAGDRIGVGTIGYGMPPKQ